MNKTVPSKARKTSTDPSVILYIVLGLVLLGLNVFSTDQIPVTQIVAWGMLGASSFSIGVAAMLRKERLERAPYQAIFLAISLVGAVLCLMGDQANRQAALTFVAFAIISGIKLYRITK